ncbi:hypothetical protein WJX81_007618 [Elliptochloris bilobata]|uniref:ADP,ATP carrier protein n=1 Tax=Elliptochloris bilobata TaxID=381761 RepID=A0AAW1SIW4_9CHLO
MSRGLASRSKRVLQAFALVNTVQNAFLAFFFVLSAYFLQLPTRDEAGVALGTASLPKLFVASFFLTIVVSPCVSAFLLTQAVDRALLLLYRGLAACTFGFFLVFVLLALPPPHAFDPLTIRAARRDPSAKERSAVAERRGLHHAASAASNGARITGNATTAQALPATADAGGKAAGARRGARQGARSSVRGGDQTLSAAQRAVRAAFYLWLGAANLVAISSLWARVSDVFSSDAGLRLFGLLSAGATCGQMAGSLAAGAFHLLLRRHGGAMAPALQPAPLLAAAALLVAAGRFAARLRPTHAALAQSGRRPLADGGGVHTSKASPLLIDMGGAAVGVRRVAAQLGEGFLAIAGSRYLLMLAGYLLLSTATSSLLYFLRAAVLAGGAPDPGGRMVLVATLNSASAGVIAVLQLCASGRLLQRMGLERALCASPAVSAALLVAIAACPTAAVVGLGEALRKVVGYAVARPAREVLFTVPASRRERTAAKLCLDTLVVRAGDSAAAALFHVLDGALELGPSGAVQTLLVPSYIADWFCCD